MKTSRLVEMTEEEARVNACVNVVSNTTLTDAEIEERVTVALAFARKGDNRGAAAIFEEVAEECLRRA